MPAFCWFYGLTPGQYRALTLDDRAELVTFMSDRLRATKGHR